MLRDVGCFDLHSAHTFCTRVGHSEEQLPGARKITPPTGPVVRILRVVSNRRFGQIGYPRKAHKKSTPAVTNSRGAERETDPLPEIDSDVLECVSGRCYRSVRVKFSEMSSGKSRKHST